MRALDEHVDFWFERARRALLVLVERTVAYRWSEAAGLARKAAAAPAAVAGIVATGGGVAAPLRRDAGLVAFLLDFGQRLWRGWRRSVSL